MIKLNTINLSGESIQRFFPPLLMPRSRDNNDLKSIQTCHQPSENTQILRQNIEYSKSLKIAKSGVNALLNFFRCGSGMVALCRIIH